MITNQENMSTWARRVLTGLTEIAKLMDTSSTAVTQQKLNLEQKKEK